ncbi:hypothetical protein K491DRAFT_596844, partial [Lophiostoma macrostomum CBS 122681]
LLETGKFSDCLVTCNGKEWKVHKSIICTRSAFFNAAMRFGKEAAQSKVDLPEDDPEIVGYMLQFVYTCDYNGSYNTPQDFEDSARAIIFDWDEHHDDLSRILRREMMEGIGKLNEKGMARAAELTEGEKFYLCEGSTQLMTHAKLYCMGDKYQVRGLQDAALEKLEYHFHDHLFELRNTYEVIQLLLHNTPESDQTIRDFIVQKVRSDMSTFGVRPDVQSLLDETPGLAAMIIRAEYSDGATDSDSK